MQNELSGFEQPKIHNRPNLDKGELEALDALSKRDNIIISKADKGGGAVIQDIDDYVAEANRQLDNKEFYEKVDHDLTPEHTIKVNKAVDQLASEGLISEKTAKSLHGNDAKTPKFSTLPKVHKPGQTHNSCNRQPDLESGALHRPPPTAVSGETTFIH